MTYHDKRCEVPSYCEGFTGPQEDAYHAAERIINQLDKAIDEIIRLRISDDDREILAGKLECLVEELKGEF